MLNGENYFSIDGVKISLKPSKGRYLRLSVNGLTAEVSVYVPRGVSVKTAKNFAALKSEWIRKSLEKTRRRIERNRPKEGSIRLFGRDVPVVKIKRGSSFFDGQTVFLSVKGEGEDAFGRSAASFYRAELYGYIKSRLPDFARKTGLFCDSWSIRSMKTRWGSCNVARKKLTFGLKLAEQSKECIDYVLLHETAHLKYADHGKNFKELLTAYMPDWKKRKKLLNGE
ncbi:MAG: M48 family metallopeptidase [Clostridia bacterium]|nr:M48 family metallopeptidase [Clostridia bacterium]